MLYGFPELAMRIGCTLLLPLWIGPTGLCFTDAGPWVPTMAPLLVSYRVMRRRYLHPGAGK